MHVAYMIYMYFYKLQFITYDYKYILYIKWSNLVIKYIILTCIVKSSFPDTKYSIRFLRLDTIHVFKCR